MFMAAEQLRDSLRALPLAARMFREIQSRYPASPIAAKALLAAAMLDAESADSLLAVLRARYSTSPYALAVQGLGGDAFRAIEDSLLGLLRSAGDEGELGAPALRERGVTEPKPKKPRIVPDR